MLSRDDILGADDLQRELVAVPEWGGDLYVRCLTGAERDRFEADMMRDEEEDQRQRFYNLRARLVVLAVCDEHNMPLFMLADAERLGAKSAKVLDRLFDVARRLSGMSQEDVEALTKNSVKVPNDASGSGLP
jgi:hypothetical protein